MADYKFKVGDKVTCMDMQTNHIHIGTVKGGYTNLITTKNVYNVECISRTILSDMTLSAPHVYNRKFIEEEIQLRGKL